MRLQEMPNQCDATQHSHTRKDERAVVVVFVVGDVEGGGGRKRDAVYRTLFFVKTGPVDEKT